MPARVGMRAGACARKSGIGGGTSWLDTHAKLLDNVKATAGPIDILPLVKKFLKP